MSGRWLKSVEENREALEALAEHGETRLADDARTLLERADKASAQA